MNKKEEKSFFKHFLIIGAGTAINMIIGLLITPIITRLVDPVEYGQLSIFLMYESIALMIFCLGLDQSLIRFYYDEDNINYKRKILASCWIPPVIFCSILGMVVTLLTYLGIIVFEFKPIYIALLSIYVLFDIIGRFSLLLIRVELKSKLYSWLNILKKIIYMIFTLVLLNLIKGHDFLMLVIANIIAVIISDFWGIYNERHIWKFWDVSLSSVINKKELIKYGAPFIISMGITMLFQAIDKISLNYYCSYSEVGVYSSAMTLVHAFSIIQSSFNSLWSPISIEHFTKYPNDKQFYRRVNQMITVVMFLFGIFLILFKDVFALLLGVQYRESAYILPFLIFNPIMYTISETTVCGMIFMKRSKMDIIIAAGACISNIIGNIILVPIYGCKGAAISTGIAYIVFFTLRTIISNRFYYINFRLDKFYTLTLVISIYALYNTFVHFNIFSVISFFIVFVITILLYKQSIFEIIKVTINSFKSINFNKNFRN